MSSDLKRIELHDRPTSQCYDAGVKQWLPWVLCLWPSLAQGQNFECSPATGSSFTQVWTDSNRCIPVAVGRQGALVRERASIVESAFRRWSRSPCSDVEFEFRGETSAPIGFDPRLRDNENVVLSTNDADMLAMFGDRRLLAVTLTSFSTATGEIFDADIIVNDALFDFEQVGDPNSCAASGEEVFDLENTLAHEVGHLLGFAHNEDESSTLFGSSPACEVQKRSLAPIDVDGLCAVYPAEGSSQACRAPDSYEVGDTGPFRNQCRGGCQCRDSGRREENSLWLLLGLALLMAARHTPWCRAGLSGR